MSIKKNGGIFGRNPTFNNVEVENDLRVGGDLIINGETVTGLDFEGSWDASTNTPDVTASPTVGQFWIVSVAGSTDLSGITTWDVGDWALYDGSAWQRVEGGGNGTFTKVNVDNLQLDGNTISNTDTNGKVIITPNGTGDFRVEGSEDFFVIYQEDEGVGIRLDCFKVPYVGPSAGYTDIKARFRSPASGVLNGGDALIRFKSVHAASTLEATNIEFHTSPYNGSPDAILACTVEPGGDFTLETGNLRIGTSGKGIDFSATAGTGTSELLNDYEEGTWQPQLRDGSGNTLDVGSGTYTKIGREVFIHFSMSNIDTSTLTSGDSVAIHGLPFASLSSQNRAGSLLMDNVTFSDQASLYINAQYNWIQIKNSRSGTTDNSVTYSALTTTVADILGSINYSVG